MKFPYIILAFFIAPILLTSCDTQNTPEQKTDTSSTSQLKAVETESELETYLKNGLKLTNTLIQNTYNAPISITETPIATTSTLADSTSTENNTSSIFSTTNTQEVNVDEADRIEYDGEFLYVLTHSNYYWYLDFEFNDITALVDTALVEPEAALSLAPIIEPPVDASPPGVRVMQRGENASMNEIAWLKIDHHHGFNGLFLAGDVLAALSASYGHITNLLVDRAPWFWGRPQTRIDLMDVSVPAEINTTHTIVLDGHMISSRRVDNRLILVTQYTPYLPRFIPYPLTDDQLKLNHELLDTINLDKLLPNKSINGEVSPMLAAADCYILKDSPEVIGYANLTVLSIINLDAPDKFSSRCFNAASQGIYASPESLYITSSHQDNKTMIHKFSTENEPLFKGSGSVPGHLGWRNPAYRMNESGDNLRVVSTSLNNNREFEHYLTVLQDDEQGHLQQLSQLPNKAQPEKIGKPGEDIQSVRFFHDRAYIVTFLLTDPLYVIDVADENAPAILGELEIPGFSTYLHPVDKNLLLGFGQQNWSDTKMSLFDISSPEDPIEIQNFIWPNTSTPLRWDPHALSFIQVKEKQYRFAFPVESWKDYSSNAYLFMFDLEINEDGTTLPRPSVLPVTTNNQWGYAYGYNQRSVIHDDEVHYVHDHRVWSASWDLSVINPEQ